MRLKLEFVSPKSVILPQGYTKYMQAMIYNIFSKKVREFVHETGFRSAKKFSLFCFSWILEEGRYIKKIKVFDFGNKISFYISSPAKVLMEDILNGLFKNEHFRLGENELYVSSVVSVEKNFGNLDAVEVSALTPIEVHRTYVENGRNKTIYFSPFEKEFSELVNMNLRNKWSAFYRQELDKNLEIIPLFEKETAERRYKKVVYYGFGNKRYIVEGWKGKYLLKGEPEVLRFVYDAGLGSKNSQGFGFIE